MKLVVRQVGRVAVVDLSGKITLGEGEVVLRERLSELLRDGQRHILLNLESIWYMDSCGIAELVACYKRAKVNNCTVKLLNPSRRVLDLLRITMLDEVFEIYRDETAALCSRVAPTCVAAG